MRWLTIFFCLCPSAALAQQGEEHPKPDPTREPPPAVKRQERPEMTSPDDQKVKIKVSTFTITGNTSIDTPPIREVVAAAEGRELTLAEIKAEAAKITEYYRAQGYALAFAYVPAQEIRDGVVEIQVVEGRIDKVVVEGNDTYSSEFFEDRLGGLQGESRMSWQDIERSLLLLDEYPGLKVQGVLRPGAATGTSDIHLRTEDRFPVLFSLDYDNYGTKTVSRNRYGGTLEFINLWDEGHSIQLRGVIGESADDLAFGRISYTAPLACGATVSGYWSHYDYEAGGRVAVLEPTGSGNVFGVNASYPIILEQATRLDVNFGLEYKNLNQRLLGTTTAEDRLRVAAAGLQIEHTDDWNGRWITGLSVRQGLGTVAGGLSHADADASRAGAGDDFTTLRFDLYRIQKATDWLFFIARFNGQYAFDEIVVSEQFGIGGPDSVRGYPNFEYLGDRGYSASIEARFKLPFFDDLEDPFYEDRTLGDLLQIAAFYDIGRGSLISPGVGESRTTELSGAGVGLRLNYTDYVSARFDVGWPLSATRPSSGDEPTYYVSVVITIN